MLFNRAGARIDLPYVVNLWKSSPRGLPSQVVAPLIRWFDPLALM